MQHKIAALVAAGVAAALPVPDAAAQLRLTEGPSFAAAKYATSTSASIWVGYGIGPASLVLGMMQNPGSDFRGHAVGVAVQLSSDDVDVIAAVNGADMSNGGYVVLSFYPSVSGPVSLSGAFGASLSTSSSNESALWLDRLWARTSIAGSVRVGAATVASKSTDDAWSMGLGPVVTTSVADATVWSELLLGVAGYTTELRLGFETSF